MWGYTLAQLRAATKTQIITWITNNLQGMTKRQIIMLLLDIASARDQPVIVHRPDGQVESHLAVERDVLGAKLGSELAQYTYYPTGEVDTITIIRQDGDDVETSRTAIKHFLDARQPVATRQ